MFRHGRRDANQARLVAYARTFGASWNDTADVGRNRPDGVLGFLGIDQQVEIKNPGARGKLSEGQLEFAAAWKGAPVVVWREERDVEMTLALLRQRSRTLAAAGLLR